LQAVLAGGRESDSAVHRADQAGEGLRVDRGIESIAFVFRGDDGEDAHRAIEAAEGELAVFGLDMHHLIGVFATCASDGAESLSERCGRDG
jgi:hypothetical protein